MAKTQVGLVILNWNNTPDTLECIASVYKSQTKTIHLTIYLVDNASTAADTSKLLELNRVTLIQNSLNLGFAGGNNVGINRALADGCDWVILLNNDTIVAPDTIQTLVSQSIKSGYDLASPKIYFYPGCEFHSDQYRQSERGHIIWYAGATVDLTNVINRHRGVDEFDHGQFDHLTTTDFVSGCCMLIGKKTITTIGSLPTIYQAYYEDADYSLVARSKGFKLGFVPASHLWHKNAGSTGGSGSASQHQLLRKSRLIFALRHAPVRAKLALIKSMIT